MTWSRIKQQLLGPAAGWRWPFYWTVFLYIAFFFLVWWGLGQPFSGYNVILDIAADVTLAFLVFAMSRRVWPFALFMLLYFTIFYGGSLLVILILGRPILPEEIHNLRALIMLLGPLGWIGIVLPLAIFAGSLVLNLHFSHLRARLAGLASVLIGCGIVGAVAGRLLRLPASFMMGPMIVSAIAHLGGLTNSQPPGFLVAAAQVVVGAKCSASGLAASNGLEMRLSR